jgi:hypothetical protein
MSIFLPYYHCRVLFKEKKRGDREREREKKKTDIGYSIPFNILNSPPFLYSPYCYFFFFNAIILKKDLFK